MGKGDKKTGKGKRAQGSYGITRKRGGSKTNSSPKTDNVDGVKVKDEAVKAKQQPRKRQRKQQRTLLRKHLQPLKRQHPKKQKKINQKILCTELYIFS